MFNIQQIIGLVILSIGTLLSIYSFQEQTGVEVLIAGLVLLLGGIGYTLWATKNKKHK